MVRQNSLALVSQGRWQITRSLTLMLFTFLCGDVAMTTDRVVRQIGSQKQLLLDDDVIESLCGAVRRTHQPTKHSDKPLISMVPETESSWDAGMMPCGFSSVIYDAEEKVFKLWYAVISISRAGRTATGNIFYQAVGDEEAMLAYATSKDGLHWDKPDLGLVELRGTLKNNLVLKSDMDGSGIFKDPHEIDSAKRYKMLWVSSDRSIHASYSADGLRWTEYLENQHVIFHRPGHDSQAAVYWDEPLGKYVAIIRDRTGRIKNIRPQLATDETGKATWRQHWGQNRSPENHSLRRVGQCESKDFIHWTPMRVIVAADADDPLTQDQFYNMEAFVYEGLRIGLMTVMSRDPNYCRGEVQLVYSRDGLNWHRGGQRKFFLPSSQTPGNFDWGSIYPHQGPLRVGNEIWIYYTGIGADHNHVLPTGITSLQAGIGVARLRLDGFVSVEAGQVAGQLTSRPFIFRGNQLVINAAAVNGEVTVELRDQEGKPLPGFTARDCDSFQGDEVRHLVTWNGKNNVSSLQGTPVKLVCQLRNARLFSFQFNQEHK